MALMTMSKLLMLVTVAMGLVLHSYMLMKTVMRSMMIMPQWYGIDAV